MLDSNVKFLFFFPFILKLKIVSCFTPKKVVSMYYALSAEHEGMDLTSLCFTDVIVMFLFFYEGIWYK